MKNVITTSKTLILVTTLLASVLLSCNEIGVFPSAPTKWVVEQVRTNKDGTSIYLVNATEKKDLRIEKTWFVDSSMKFNAGDTLSFQYSR
jgi:hypothetical protein